MNSKVYFEESTEAKPVVKEPLVSETLTPIWDSIVHYSDNTIAIDGYKVPNILLSLAEGADDNEVYAVTLHERFGYCFNDGNSASTAIHLAANAMAIACGFSSFGEHCRPLRPSPFSQWVGDGLPGVPGNK